jgi:AraC-like DNA-binding protein
MASAVPYVEAVPAGSLRPFVQRYWSRRGRAAAGDEVVVLPDGCADVILDLRSGRGVVVGTMTRALRVGEAGEVDAFGIRFAPGGLHALSALPLQPLTDRTVSLADLDPLRLAALAEALCAARFGDRCAAADRALLAEARARAATPPPLAPLLARLERAPSLPRVSALAAELGVAERTLERRFLAAVGVGPKVFLRWLRFERARTLLAAGHPAGEVAAALYADQAHLVHEFRSFAGEPPGAWLAARPRLSDSSKTPRRAADRL